MARHRRSFPTATKKADLANRLIPALVGAVLVLCRLSGLPSPLDAQVVQGQVVDSTSQTPVARGFVVLVDASGEEVVRSLTSGDGRFTLQAPAPGQYRLRSERIGYRAATSQPFALEAGETLDYTLRVAALPIRLSTVVVSGRDRCNANPEQGERTALVWEEIRKALAATVWGDEQELFHYRQYTYRRALNERRSRKNEETITTKSGLADPPFRSISAERLAREGYIAERPDGTWYYLPDAQTLLDDSFLDTHCFHVMRDERERPGQVGLAFEPMRDRRLPDVRGALWLDEESSELRELEVRHTKVSYGVRDGRIGGNVRFLMLPSGAWIVRDWQVRTPHIDVTEHPRYVGGYKAEVAGFTDSGGEIFLVSARDGTTVYEAPVATVIGTVFDSTSGSNLGRAFVTVAGTDFRAFSDSAGTFDMRLPLDGEYTLELSHPRLDSLAAPEVRETVDLTRGSVTRVALEVPHAESNFRRLCGRDADRTGSRAILGVVRESGSGNPVNDATVTARWQDILVMGHGETANEPVQLAARNNEARAGTDRSGFFVVCGVPSARPIRLSAEKDGSESREASVLFPERPGGQLELAWDRRPGAPFEHHYPAPNPFWKVDLTLGAGPRESEGPSSPVLYGVVTDSASGEPLSGVGVAANGMPRTVTATDGSYELADVSWRESGNRIEFRRLGYAAAAIGLQVENVEDEVRLDISLPQLPVRLAEVVVEGRRISVPARLVGFYERRKVGIGEFLTEEDWERRPDSYVGQVLHRQPGIDVANGWRVLVSSAPYSCRSRGISARIWVDGVSVHPGFIQDIKIEDVVAIEVYQRIADIPAQYNSSADQKYGGGGSSSSAACGVVLIWTR